MEPDHLRAERTDRGFKYLPDLHGRVPGETFRVYESSLAGEPSIWVGATEPDDRNAASRGERYEVTAVTAELTLERAAELRDQLDWMIRNHYQHDADYDPPSLRDRIAELERQRDAVLALVDGLLAGVQGSEFPEPQIRRYLNHIRAAIDAKPVLLAASRDPQRHPRGEDGQFIERGERGERG